MNIDNAHITELQTLIVKVGKNTYPVFNFNLSLAVNAMPVGTIALSVASKPTIKIDDECSVVLTRNGSDVVLFSGYISSVAVNTSTFVSHIENYLLYTISSKSAAIDAIPPTAWVYLTNAVDTENLVVQGFTKVGKGALGQTDTELERNKGETNIPAIICNTINSLQGHISQMTNPPDLIGKFIKGDNLRLNLQGTDRANRYINDRIVSLIEKSKQSYLDVIRTVCQEFYLTLVPSKKDNYLLRMRHVNPWRASKHTITWSDYTAISMTNISLKGKEIDGIIMPYYDTTGTQVTTTGLFCFYGVKEQKTGAKIEIFDTKSAQTFYKQGVGSLRYKQISTPSWLAQGLGASSLRPSVQKIVKEHFLSYAYGTNQIMLNVPYAVYETLVDRIGDTVTVQTLADHISMVNKKNTKDLKGILSGLNIDIRTVASRLSINCTATISHAHEVDIEKQLNIVSESGLYLE